MAFGMIGYVIPLGRYSKIYNKQPLMCAALASQDQYVLPYLVNVYGDRCTERWFNDSYKITDKKRATGKPYVRFKALSGLPLNAMGG